MAGLGKGHGLYESFIMYFLLDYFAWDDVYLPPYKDMYVHLGLSL